MNFATVPLPLRFDGQTEELGWLGWLSQAHQTGGDDRVAVFQQLTQIAFPDHHLNVVLLNDDPLQDASEQVSKVICRKRSHPHGQFLGPGNELVQDGWTFRGSTQFVEYLRIGSEESLESFRDPTLNFVRRQTSRSRVLAGRILDDSLRDVIPISPAPLDCERRGEAIPFPIFDQTRQQT